MSEERKFRSIFEGVLDRIAQLEEQVRVLKRATNDPAPSYRVVQGAGTSSGDPHAGLPAGVSGRDGAPG